MTTNITACQLTHRGVLRVNGADRHVFLQGLISNDIGLCKQDKPIYAALLTPQGKFLHDLFVYEFGDSFLIDCEAERTDDLLRKLTAYKLRAKILIENVSTQFHVWAFPNGGIGLIDPHLSGLGTRAILEAGKLPNKADICHPSLYDNHRLILGVPEGSRDMIVGKSTLSDGNFDLLNGISWTKGCYVGQELTARMHHRALVKKRMFPVKISGTAPKPDTIVHFGDAEIGEMRSSNGDIGLALLNIDTAQLCIQENGVLTTETGQLRPYLPSWLKP